MIVPSAEVLLSILLAWTLHTPAFGESATTVSTASSAAACGKKIFRIFHIFRMMTSLRFGDCKGKKF
jgi:hypothetical protein